MGVLKHVLFKKDKNLWYWWQSIFFYMATPPNLYEAIAVNLVKLELVGSSSGYRRFIIEKPFGFDLESGKKLNRTLHEIIEGGADFSGLIIILVKKLYRIFWSPDLLMAYLNHSGTEII